MPAFFQKLEKLKPVYDWAYKIILLICKLLLIADIIITSWSVAGRYIPFITDPHWSEEIVLTFMVYMAVLSATLAIRKRSHIRMTAFDKYLPKKVLVCMDLLADVAVLILGIVLLVQGAKVVSPTGNIAKFAKYSSLPKLSQIWMYMPVPVAGIGMILFELEQIFLRIEELFDPNVNNGKEAQA
ncbi:MAG: TRAP transporter small permease [Clostridia bacterium]|nr:TRAP transporter small permease [Clostridia bacterium]